MNRSRSDGWVDPIEYAMQFPHRAGDDGLGWAWNEANRELSPRGTPSREWYEDQMDRLGSLKWVIVDMWP